MTRLRGIDYEAGKALFEVETQFVVVDINKRDVVQVETTLEAVTADGWLKVGPALEYPDVWRELAEAAVTKLDVQQSEITSAERTYKIPNAVKVEAQQSLDWVSGFSRGKSNIGLIIAKQLVNEKHLNASEVARLHRYFSRVSKRSFSDGWTPGQQGYPTDERIRFAMRGGEAGKAWVEKIVARHGLTAAGEVDGDKPHEFKEDPEIPGACIVCGRGQEAPVHTAVVASAFEYDPTCEYFGHGLDPDETLVDGLLMLRPDGTWHVREGGVWAETSEPGEDEIVIMLDEESAYRLAEIIDDMAPEDPSILPYELAMLNPHEAALFALAEPEEDWEFIDRVTSMFDIYDSTERSINAKKQVRGPGGRFGDTPDAGDDKPKQQTKARLPQALPLVPDIAARIREYMEANAAAAPAEEVQETPVAETGIIDAQFLNKLIDPESFAEGDAAPAQPAADANAPRPLYLAIVDGVDTAAVLDLVALMPGNPPVMWKRDGGAWVQAPEILAQLQGTQPPPVVELTDDAIVADVITQVDASTAGETEAEEAAPTPGATEQAPNGATGAKPDANPDQHPVAAASSIPMWGPHGQLLDLTQFAGGFDRNRGNAEELRKYWTRGKGALKIRWNTPGDMTRCMRLLRKYLKGREAGYCALRHREMTGMWPGDRDNRDDK